MSCNSQAYWVYYLEISALCVAFYLVCFVYDFKKLTVSNNQVILGKKGKAKCSKINKQRWMQYIQFCIELPKINVICEPGVAGEASWNDGVIGAKLFTVLHYSENVQQQKKDGHLCSALQSLSRTLLTQVLVKNSYQQCYDANYKHLEFPS